MTELSGLDTLAPNFGAKYGGSLISANPAPADTPLTRITGPTENQVQASKPWHPSSPMMAFGAILGVTFGLLAFSGSVRAGRTTARVSVGDTG